MFISFEILSKFVLMMKDLRQRWLFEKKEMKQFQLVQRCFILKVSE